MSTIEERTLELNVVSAFDLKKVRAFGEQNCFVSVYINKSEKKTSPVDYTGGRNPLRNWKLTLTCDELLFRTDAFITVEIYTYGRIVNKLVGTVSIPLHKLVKHRKPGSTPHVMGYKVHRKSGRTQGVLNMAVKLGEKKSISTLPPPRCYGI